jgi:hypothetical protein
MSDTPTDPNRAEFAAAKFDPLTSDLDAAVINGVIDESEAKLWSLLRKIPPEQYLRVYDMMMYWRKQDDYYKKSKIQGGRGNLKSRPLLVGGCLIIRLRLVFIRGRDFRQPRGLSNGRRDFRRRRRTGCRLQSGFPRKRIAE